MKKPEAAKDRPGQKVGIGKDRKACQRVQKQLEPRDSKTQDGDTATVSSSIQVVSSRTL
jgi:hypothetical protein